MIKSKQWSKNFTKCVKCFSTEKKHVAGGYCYKCYKLEETHSINVEYEQRICLSCALDEEKEPVYFSSPSAGHRLCPDCR